MKAELTRVTLCLAVILAVSSVALAQAPQQPQMPMGPSQGMGGGSMGPGMMGPGMMGPGMMGGGTMGSPGMGPMGGSMGAGGDRVALDERPLISIMLRLRQQLGLSGEQAAKLTTLRSNFEKEAIRTGAEIRVIEVELDDLLDQDPVDLGKVEAAFRKEEALRTTLRFSRVKTIEAGKAVLNAEQRDKLKKALETGPGMGMMGSGMMGPGMMGPGGQGQGMMMGPQMMQQMMGGGMGQQAAAGSYPSPATAVGSERIDTTGPVTVKATLLGPGAAGDSLRMQIVLDTHSVDLDGYRFEEIVRLRDGRGSEVAPAVVEGAKGSGHHREATVRFTWPDPKPNSLELVVKGVAGVPERVFRWSLQ